MHLAVGRRHAVEHARRRRHQVHVVLALEPLLHDLHVQQAEEAAAEAEAERRRRLRLVEERGVVQPQLLERLAQLGVLVALHRIEPGEHHRLQFLEAGKRLRGRPCVSVTVSPILASATTLMLATTKPTSPTPSSSTGVAFGENTPRLEHLEILLRRHQADLRLRPQHAVDHADDDDDAAIGVVPGVEDQRLERRVGIAGRRMEPRDDRFEDLADAGAFLGAGEDRVEESRPMMSSIWRLHSSGCALGRSILLMTGMISRLLSTAR